MDRSSKTPTMADIAMELGVSKMTVSLALRGSSRVSEKTRKRILEVAEQMHYRPNPMVQTLMANLRATRQVEMHSVIAWVIAAEGENAWSNYWVFEEYFKGASERAQQLGYRIEPFWAFSKGMTGARLTSVLRARGINGVVVPPVPSRDTRIDLDWSHFALATIGYSFMNPALPRAAANLIESMSQALSKCEELGYKRIGYVTPAETDTRVNHAWLSTYLVWQQFIPKKLVIPHLYVPKDERIEDHLGPWLERYKPEVIVAPIMEFIYWLPEHFGLKIPEDIGFVSLSKPIKDKKLNQTTGINQRDAAVGAAAIDLVISQLQRNEIGLPQHPKVVLCDGVWEAGNTTVSPTVSVTSK